MEKKAGDIVWYWYDTGAFGCQVLYGVVVKAGPKQIEVVWESGLRNRCKQSDVNVKPVKPEDLDYARSLLISRGVLNG